MDSSSAPQKKDQPGFTPETLALRAFLRRATPSAALFETGEFSAELRHDVDGVWLIIARKGQGGLALRCVPTRGLTNVHIEPAGEDGWNIRIDSAEGLFRVRIERVAARLVRLRCELTPHEDLLIPFWPRDLYPLGAGLDPTRAKGWVEAAQRGVNTGLCFFSLSEPDFGAALYLQDLSALNEFFDLTKAKPDGVVGGEWPEIGYQPPTAPLGNSPPTHPLPKGRAVTIADTFLSLSPDGLRGEQQTARLFLDLLGQIYRHIAKPEPALHDWAARAKSTIHDLTHTGEVRVEFKEHIYFKPYVGAEHPDSMVQATIGAAAAEYEHALGLRPDLSGEIAAGMVHFFDDKLGALRRFLPNAGDDKDPDEVDSWYLYHPLMNLARLAALGNRDADTLFWKALPYAIEAAHHFKYKWPISFRFSSFEIIKADRDGDGNGQTDVGGLYAYVMLRAYALSHDAPYLDEAGAAIRASCGKRFELAYQTNLTAWGAVACLELWRIDGDDFFRRQSDVYVACFLHNCEMWESEIECAKHYRNFLGATCLHDGLYMAAFECFDSFSAFQDYLRIGGDDISEHMRAMLRDYCAHALDRARYYYPGALPREVLSGKIRSGRIDRTLSFPLEDLYGDGQQAGQIGQEVYGCGGALIFAAHLARRTEEASAARFEIEPAKQPR